MYEELKENVKRQLIDISKEELIDMLSEYIIAYFLGTPNAVARIVVGETVQLINNQIEINQESMEVKGVSNDSTRID